MREILGMSANVPTDIVFSFTGLIRRGSFGGGGREKACLSDRQNMVRIFTPQHLIGFLSSPRLRGSSKAFVRITNEHCKISLSL